MKTVFSIAIVCLFTTTFSQVDAQDFVTQTDRSMVENRVVKASCCRLGRGWSAASAFSSTLQEMWNREHPDGTQHGHLAYPSNGIYYYHRPYNGSHYRQHQMRLSQSIEFADSPKKRFNEGFQYVDPRENHLFRLQVRSADPKNDSVDSPKDSGVLEFADWKRYEAANLAWEKEQESLTPEENTSARLSSHAK